MTQTTIYIPVLETERLVLRAHNRRDWEAYRPILMTDRARYMEGKQDDLGAWSSFASETASWVLDGFGYWTAARKSDDQAVAFVGIMKPSAFPETELGWMTTAESEGKGYAFEASKAVLAWGFGPLGLDALVSYIHPENARSISLAERLGATLDKNAPRPDPNDLVYRHHKPT